MRFEKAILILKKDSREAIALGNEIERYLEKGGIEVYKSSEGILKSRNIEEKAFAIVLGGDGTLLWAVSELGSKKLPLIGINLGSLGFLTDLNKNNWRHGIEKILKGNFFIEEKSKIGAFLGNSYIGSALNEVVVKAKFVEAIEFEIFVDNNLAERVIADGVIVATPTGSTAYSMSAGGAIVDPRVKAFIITLISPFKLGTRPLVVPEKSEIEIRVGKGVKAIVAIDGMIKAEASDRVICKIAEEKAYFVKIENDFYRKINERLKA